MFRCLFVALVFCASSVMPVAPNQMGMTFNDGVQKNNLKLSLGVSSENHPALRTYLAQGQFEFFATDRFSVRGNSGIPISSTVSGMKYYPLLLGGAFHFFPRFWFDLYVGADAGFVHIATPTLAASWSTRITPVVGATLYYWGIFFIEGEAGYSVLKYAEQAALDLSAPTYRVRVGFYL